MTWIPGKEDQLSSIEGKCDKSLNEKDLVWQNWDILSSEEISSISDIVYDWLKEIDWTKIAYDWKDENKEVNEKGRREGFKKND